MNPWLFRLIGLAIHVAIAVIWDPMAAAGFFGIGGFLLLVGPGGSGGGPPDGQPPMDM